MNNDSSNSLFLEVNDYLQIDKFVRKYKKLSYLEFDNYSVDKLNLFTVHENFDFSQLEETIDKIVEAIPQIKRIFAKPLIHLIDQDTILPVEAVKKISNDTMNHISFHSELWDNVRGSEIQPRKLLTKNNIDNYSIYENVAFAHLINIILSFCHHYIHFLKDYIYTNSLLSVNYLDRIDHIKYYLSLGKLHTGYIRNFEKNYVVIDRCLNKLNYIYTVVSARVKRPVYKINQKKDRNGFTLKKTNILKMHKDYHKIYLLLKFLSTSKVIETTSISENDLTSLKKSYFEYVELMSIFSLINFNFKCSKSEEFDFESLDSTFKAKDFTLKLTKKNINKINVLKFSFKKNKEYSIALIPVSNTNDIDECLSKVKEKMKADEYIVSSLFEGIKDTLYIAINNIDSFRRIQQLVLRGMVYSDSMFDVCPFCLGDLVEINENGKIKYECSSCRDVIEKIICTECENEYFITSIKDYKNFVDINRRLNANNTWLINRNIESLMHYRNITKIDEDMNFICPHCESVNKN